MAEIKKGKRMKRLIQKKLKKTKENLYYILSALMIGLIVGGIDALFGRVLIAITVIPAGMDMICRLQS